jgi:predicted nucleic acid-binding protein
VRSGESTSWTLPCALVTPTDLETARRSVVIDASVALRLLLDGSPEAAAVVASGELTAPEVIVAETLNGLVSAVRFAGLELNSAAALLERFLRLPIELVADRELAAKTLGVATELGLSAYDAAYVALALARDLPLFTADKPVAASYLRSELIP